MIISLHIEQLIIEGLDIPDHQHGLLQSAIETELVNLLAAGQLGPQMLAGGRLPDRQGGVIHIGGDPATARPDPVRLGRQIAQAVFEGIPS